MSKLSRVGHALYAGQISIDQRSQPIRGRSEVAGKLDRVTGLMAKAPSPIRMCATAAATRNAGYSQPPFGALKTQPFGAWMRAAPSRTGSSATETMRA